ncbi:MAG: NnrU family protein, partial [Thiohalomonadaceae bacterium]
ERRWQGIYSLVALAGVILIVYGYGAARQVPMVIYEPPPAMRHIAFLLMVPVFPLLIAAYAHGRIRDFTRHPMLLATSLWAFAHLLANGTLADLLLFGAFFVWAAADRVSMSYRIQRPLPEAPATRWNDAIAVVAGLALYAGFLFGLHGKLIGVPLLS